MNALTLFEREGIVSLPLDPAALARKNGVRLVTYATFAATAKGKGMTFPSPDGFLLRGSSSPVIVYNEAVGSRGRQRWTLVHELCHLWLGHEASDPRTEQEVDRLTASLISPLVVLHLCGVTDAGRLAALCGISGEAARVRFSELTRRRMARNFLEREEERRIAVRFLPFISETLCDFASERVARQRLRSPDILRQEEF